MTNLLGEHGLDNVDCDICGNTGWVVWKENNELRSKECSCMAKRRSLRRLKQSGMEVMFERYTFDNYEAKDKYRAALLGRAKDYVEDTKGWFYIAGTSGSGKTHICTAICKAFIDKGVEVYYMNWRDESVALKNDLTNGDSYSEKIKRLKSVELLYIDDFFKGGASEADKRLAFEILNARYNKQLRTVVSSEVTLDGLFDIDEAIAGRVYELSYKPRYLIRAPKENWRRKQMQLAATETENGGKSNVGGDQVEGTSVS